MSQEVGRVEDVRSGRIVLLNARTIIGRLPTCQLQIASPSVSALHAQIVWDGSGWQVHDLGSRNGTYIDGRRLPPGQQAPLTKDVTATFGLSEHSYRLIDASPPGLTATSDHGDARASDGDVLCLPSADTCEVTIYRDSEQRWVASSEAGERPLEDPMLVTAGNRTWRIGLPGSVALTDDMPAPPEAGLRSARLSFCLSRDGEHLTAQLEQGGQTVQLEYRAHLFLLLELARARLADAAQKDLPATEHGWVYIDDLLTKLRVPDTHLNIWAHRARNQLIKCDVRGAGALLERRAGTRQIRIGVERLCIA